VRRKLRDILAPERDGSRHRTQQARERAHERRFAGAVRAQHGDHLPLAHAQIDALQHRLGAIAGGELADVEQRSPR
jgi:hypothetical protein